MEGMTSLINLNNSINNKNNKMVEIKMLSKIKNKLTNINNNKDMMLLKNNNLLP